LFATVVLAHIHKGAPCVLQSRIYDLKIHILLKFQMGGGR